MGAVLAETVLVVHEPKMVGGSLQAEPLVRIVLRHQEAGHLGEIAEVVENGLESPKGLDGGREKIPKGWAVAHVLIMQGIPGPGNEVGRESGQAVFTQRESAEFLKCKMLA